MTTLTVGIDVSQDNLDAAVITPGIDEPIDLGEFPNNAGGFEQLKKKVNERANQAQTETILVVMEPTGGYELPFARFAMEQRWRVSMPNPRHVRQWYEGTGGRAKTDKIDARTLSRYGISVSVPDWKPLPKNVAQLDALLSRKEELKKNLQQEKNRKHALKSQDAYTGPVAESVERTIAHMEKEIQAIDEAIKKLLKENSDLNEQLKQLKTIPGVGEKNSLFLLVLMHRWYNMTDGKGSRQGLTAYVGLDPVPYKSGTSVYRRSKISRKGDPCFRSQLYMGALGGVQGNNPLREFYQRLVSHNKDKKLALTAAARKILVWSWAIFQANTTFDSSRATANC